jgi:hypothetical protein
MMYKCYVRRTLHKILDMGSIHVYPKKQFLLLQFCVNILLRNALDDLGPLIYVSDYLRVDGGRADATTQPSGNGE